MTTPPSPLPKPSARAPSSAIERLLDDPHRFGFFQAVRLLERWMQREEGLDSAQVLSGRIGFRNTLSLAFPPSEIAELRVLPQDAEPAQTVDATRPIESQQVSALAENAADTAADAAAGGLRSRSVRRVEITPAFFGLLGTGGALPTHYTELLAEREASRRDADRYAPRAFYDIFLHRAAALFYQGWRKHRLPVQFEADRRNRYLPLMLSMAGVGHPALRDRLRAREGGISDDALAYYAATFQRRPVSAASLQQVLQHYFDVPVKLENFIGRWFTLPEANRSQLGLSNMRLGTDALVGERVWQRDLRLRLTFGPLDHDKFSRFLPGGPAALALKELLTLMTGVTLEYEIRLALRAKDVRGCRLGDSGPRLGWDSYLITRASNADRSDAGYDLLALA